MLKIIIIAILLLIILMPILYLRFGVKKYDQTVSNSVLCGKKPFCKTCDSGECKFVYDTTLSLDSSVSYTTWDTTLYKYIVNLLILAYDMPNVNVNNDLKLEDVVYIGTDPSVYIFSETSNPDNIIIIFKGTTTKFEWSEDAKIRQTTFDISGNDSVGIHKGFLDIYDTYVRDKLMTKLKMLKPSRISVGGHSLGASIATISMFDITTITNNVVLYTIGSPRVGDEKFTKAFNNLNVPYFRVANDADIVPISVPPLFLSADGDTLTYQHTGELKMFYANWLSFTNNHNCGNYLFNADKIS